MPVCRRRRTKVLAVAAAKVGWRLEPAGESDFRDRQVGLIDQSVCSIEAHDQIDLEHRLVEVLSAKALNLTLRAANGRGNLIGAQWRLDVVFH